jgi:hypothetical protein
MKSDLVSGHKIRTLCRGSIGNPAGSRAEVA